jgi:hypothetical protein
LFISIVLPSVKFFARANLITTERHAADARSVAVPTSHLQPTTTMMMLPTLPTLPTLLILPTPPALAMPAMPA